MSWGSAVREAFEPAAHRLALTGTPFRSDVNAIPFVRYEPDGEGLPRSSSDHSYGYADALRDGVVRPVLFLAYSGEMRWRTRAGDEVAARLGEDVGPDATAQALRTALDPKGEWIASVLAAADRRLTEVRRAMPDAGGLVIATDHEHARAYARLLSRICGEKVPTVLSDDPKASRRHRAVRGVVGPLAGGGPDGLRGSRHPPAGRRRLRDDHDDAAVLRAGGRPLRARTTSRRDRIDLPAQRPVAAAARGDDGGRA